MSALGGDDRGQQVHHHEPEEQGQRKDSRNSIHSCPQPKRPRKLGSAHGAPRGNSTFLFANNAIRIELLDFRCLAGAVGKKVAIQRCFRLAKASRLRSPSDQSAGKKRSSFSPTWIARRPISEMTASRVVASINGPMTASLSRCGRIIKTDCMLGCAASSENISYIAKRFFSVKPSRASSASAPSSGRNPSCAPSCPRNATARSGPVAGEVVDQEDSLQDVTQMRALFWL